MAELKEKRATEGGRKLSPFQELIFLGVGGCVVIGFFDGFFPLPYLFKSMIKWVLFLGIPLYYSEKYEKNSFQSIKELFAYKKETMKWAGGLGAFAFLVIVGAYFITRSFVDLSPITGELDTRMDIDRSNFLAVALYIPIFNSFLEEFFFRGFLFFRIKEQKNGRLAHLLSAMIFTFYHIPMVLAWFEWWVFLLCMASLMIAGVVFNLLNEKTGSLYPSWLTHGCANFGINAVGMVLIYG